MFVKLNVLIRADRAPWTRSAYRAYAVRPATADG